MAVIIKEEIDLGSNGGSTELGIVTKTESIDVKYEKEYPLGVMTTVDCQRPTSKMAVKKCEDAVDMKMDYKVLDGTAYPLEDTKQDVPSFAADDKKQSSDYKSFYGNLEEYGIVTCNIDGDWEVNQSDEQAFDDKTLFRHELEGVNSYLACNICDKRFPHYSKMKEHLHIHTGDRPYRCNVCGKQFKQLGHMKHHMKIHTVSVTSISKGKSKDCVVCGKKFYCNSELTRHVRTHSKEKPFACTKCDKRFTQRIHLTQHLKTAKSHIGDILFQCDQCRFCFDDQEQLTSHLQTHIKVKTNLDCSYCEKRFPCKSKLARHLLAHSGEKPLVCTLCDKRFKHAPQLRDHIKIHFGKTFVCRPCGECFDADEKLAKHLESHATENPLQCRYCKKIFPCKSKLTRHIHVHTDTTKPVVKTVPVVISPIEKSVGNDNVSVVSVDILPGVVVKSDEV